MDTKLSISILIDNKFDVWIISDSINATTYSMYIDTPDSSVLINEAINLGAVISSQYSAVLQTYTTIRFNENEINKALDWLNSIRVLYQLR
jgi:hypothetical protein